MPELDDNDAVRRSVHAALEPLLQPGAARRIEQAVHRRIGALALPQDVAETRRTAWRPSGLLAGVLAGALLAGALAVGFGLRRSAEPSGSAVPSGHATPAPVPAAAARYVWISARAPRSPQHTEVHVLDWNGSVHAAFTLPSPRDTRIQASTVRTVSPDGTRALLSDGTVLDDHGAVVAGWPASGGALNDIAPDGAMWADSTTLCTAGDLHDLPIATAAASDPSHPAIEPVVVSVSTVRGTTRLAQVQAAAPPYPAGAGAPVARRAQVLACSRAADRVVVAQYVQSIGNTATPRPGNIADTGDGATVWVVQLSTGRVLHTLSDVRVDTGRSMIASRDGRVLVEFPPGRDPGGAPRLVQIDTGRVVHTFGIVDVAAVSDDDARAVTRTYGNIATGQGGHDVVSLVDVASGRTLWSVSEAAGAIVATDAQSGAVMVAAGRYTQGQPQATLRLFLVDAGGAWRELPLDPATAYGAGLAGPQPLTMG